MYKMHLDFRLKYFLFCILTFSAVVGKARNPSPDVNGGKVCAACTFIVGVLEQLAQVHNSTISDTVHKVCDHLPVGSYSSECKKIVDWAAPIVVDLIYYGATPDVICHSLKFCRVDSGHQQCRLFPPPFIGISKLTEKLRPIVRKHAAKSGMNLDGIGSVCELPGIHFFCYLLERVYDNHTVAIDLDGDGHSTIETLRGSDWKGKDCDDLDGNMYPGRKPVNHDIFYDSNCNGVYGVSPDGTPYEDMFCNDTLSYGIGVLGDSAMAHFHIPEEWVWPELLTWDMLAHLPYFLENELDWPMMSAATGFKNITWPIISGPVYSIYQQLRNRNRCNHRDYQNLGVNGADSHDMLHNQFLLTRSQTDDNPMLLFYALVGNDVCNHYPDTEYHMTTTEEMKSNVLHTLGYLDTKLAKGSRVVLMGLADGRFLYEELRQRLHPIGKVNGDVTYPNFYDYFSCLQINPCTGWMSTNETLRNFTSQRAEDLSATMQNIAKSYKNHFKHFDLTYIECPLIPVIKQWEKVRGKGSGWQLIEPVDGFHPNTYGESLSANYMWKLFEKYLPDLVGEINPHNKEIQDIFGDQGGH